MKKKNRNLGLFVTIIALLVIAGIFQYGLNAIEDEDIEEIPLDYKLCYWCEDEVLMSGMYIKCPWGATETPKECVKEPDLEPFDIDGWLVFGEESNLPTIGAITLIVGVFVGLYFVFKEKE